MNDRISDLYREIDALQNELTHNDGRTSRKQLLSEVDAARAEIKLLSEALRVRVIVSDYTSAHATTPRGEGNWAFCTVNPNRDDYLDHLIWKSGRYTSARFEAVKEAAARNVGTLYLCS
jgi:hypothetical protein